MARTTGIEWTDVTWNPIRGCSRVSEGCRHCYAETVANRFSGPGKPYEGLVQIDPVTGKGNGKWNGQIRFVEKHLLDPLRIKTSSRIFVNSMSDLFHEGVTDEMLDRIFAVMALATHHTFQVLTKRPERMLAYLTSEGVWHRIKLQSEAISRQLKRKIDWSAHRFSDRLDHVWLGASIEGDSVRERSSILRRVPAAVRFLSCEPLIQPLLHLNLAGIDWVICGGESGPGARPMHPDWARSLRDQCVAAGVPFFFKQWGEWAPIDSPAEKVKGQRQLVQLNGQHCSTALKDGVPDCAQWMERVGKKAAGRLLDWREWNEMPEAAHG